MKLCFHFTIFIFSNSTGPDEMSYFVFHMGLHKLSFLEFPVRKFNGNIDIYYKLCKIRC